MQTQLLLRSVERLPITDRDAVLGLVGRAAVDEVDATLPVAWHPMSLHMRLSDAVRDVVGPQRNIAVWTETMKACFDRPLLRSFITMSTSLFGASPLAVLRQGDRIYTQLTRDLGAVRFIPDASGVAGEITLVGFPARQFRFICYVEGLMGCIDACFALVGAQGTITILDHDDVRGEVRYGVRWSEIEPP